LRGLRRLIPVPLFLVFHSFEVLQTMKTRITGVLLLVLFLLVGCSQIETGELVFRANGEDFVRQGFVSKDDWAITFDHVYVNLSAITAYQTDPPYDPHSETPIDGKAEAGLEGAYTIDLAEGGADAEPLFIGAVAEAPAGQFNALSWRLVPATDGAAAGSSLVMVGTAVAADQTTPFTIAIPTSYEYWCGDYVGDARKGILAADGTADMELTFHFDHIFGDADTSAEDDLNVGAPGFAPFAAVANGGELNVTLADLQAQMEPAAYQMLVDILPTLGHVGEGHCYSR
jgi:hypothetical protein